MRVVEDRSLDALLAANARADRALHRARAAWQAAVHAHRRGTRDAMTQVRCARCGLRILGLPRDRAVVTVRAAIHATVCPGGDRGGDVWSPLVRRADAPPSWGPSRRLIRGGTRRSR